MEKLQSHLMKRVDRKKNGIFEKNKQPYKKPERKQCNLLRGINQIKSKAKAFKKGSH